MSIETYPKRGSVNTRWAPVVVFFAAVWIVAIVAIVLVSPKVSDQSKAERYLGGDAVCGDSHNSTLHCTKAGVVLTCVVHDDRVGCGQGDPPMAEGSK